MNGVTICDPEVEGKGSDGLTVDGACASTACLARGVCVAGFQRVESVVNLVWRRMRLNQTQLCLEIVSEANNSGDGMGSESVADNRWCTRDKNGCMRKFHWRRLIAFEMCAKGGMIAD